MANQKKVSVKTQNPKVSIISGFLNILWIDAATFISSPKRIVLRFYTELPDIFTLHGWTNDNNSFNINPDIKFLMGQPSTIPFGDKTYFGNLVLTKPDRKAIKTQITNGSFKYVLFKPHDPAGTPGQITYDIELTNDDPTITPFALVTTPTNKALNPSPPRNPQ